MFSFNSKRVQCIGLIKDVVVGLTQVPAKTVVMDIIVADIPPKFGMLLSRSWAAKIKGTMQMDLNYATIHVFGEQRRLYRKTRMAYMVSSKDKPQNFPIYALDTELGYVILFNDLTNESEEERKAKIRIPKFSSLKISKHKISKSAIRRWKVGGHCILMDQQEEKEQDQGFGLKIQVMRVSYFPIK